VFFSNDFDTGQSSGTTITTVNSGTTGDTAFSAVSGSCTYSNVNAHSGTLGWTPNTAGVAQLTWNSVGTPSSVWNRFYIFVVTIQTSGVRIFQTNGNVTSNLHRIAFSAATGKLTINVGGSGVVTGTNVVTAGQWCRIESFATLNGTTGTFEVKLFLNAESPTATETLNTSAATTDTSIAKSLLGTGSAATSAFYMDDWQFNDTAYPGPMMPNPPRIVVPQAVNRAARF
jgi:hypothetical protein